MPQTAENQSTRVSLTAMPDDDEHAAERGVGAIAFPDVPRLELDELLTQLISRAEDVLAAQGRLRGLLSATQTVIGDLALPVVLRRIVEAACELVDAGFGALGVLAEDGRLSEFISVGQDDGDAEAIGRLPELRGLLGALVEGGEPIRLDRLADDPRSVGLPPGHSAVEGFLGVPLRVREEVFGNLYLCNSRRGRFTAEDEELVVALAATAAVSIENARLFDEARRRQEWLQASAQITRHLLSVEGEDPLAVIARQAAQLADADAVSVVLPTPDGEQLMVEVTVGPGSESLIGYTYPIENTYGGQALTTGRPVLVSDALSEGGGGSTHLANTMQVGPVMVLPLAGGARRARGALILGRTHGRRRFEHADLGMATTFANHAALALELADARDNRQRMILLEDRDRIARDLHDHVIQRLFAAGLSVQSVASGIDDAAKQERLERAVSDIDDTIRQIRTSIFQLRGALGPRTTTLRNRLLDVVGDVTPMLGFEPEVRFDGPVDTAVPDPAFDDLLAVAREGLTNVARHAAASHVRMEVRAGAGTLSLEISDDGVGMGETGRRSGLANLRLRAERLGGSFEITANVTSKEPGSEHDARGTRLRWTIPLD
jgi:signal transduction histidine kinase